MTISQESLREEYTASAGQTVFTFAFRAFSASDVDVYQTPSGAEYDDTANQITAFSVSLNADQDASPGGTITLDSGAAVGDRITLVSSIPYTRTTDYETNAEFNEDTVDADFDRIASLASQASAEAGRSLAFPVSMQGASTGVLPEPEAGSLLAWNDEGGIDNLSASDFTGPQGPAGPSPLYFSWSNVANPSRIVFPVTGSAYRVTGTINAAGNLNVSPDETLDIGIRFSHSPTGAEPSSAAQAVAIDDSNGSALLLKGLADSNSPFDVGLDVGARSALRSTGGNFNGVDIPSIGVSVPIFVIFLGASVNHNDILRIEALITTNDSSSESLVIDMDTPTFFTSGHFVIEEVVAV